MYVSLVIFFFFNDTATTEIYTLSLHDALPIFHAVHHVRHPAAARLQVGHAQPWEVLEHAVVDHAAERSEEHTSELQSRQYLVCRLLLEKKNKFISRTPYLLMI